MPDDGHTANNMLENVPEGFPGRTAILSQTVASALGILLLAIDQCRYLFDTISSSRAAAADPIARRYKGLITSREQKELDAALESFFKDADKQASEELQKLGITPDQVIAEFDQRYPFPEEAVATGSQIAMSRIYENLQAGYIEKYADNPIKQQYIITKLSLGEDTIVNAVLGSAMVPFIVSKLEGFLAALVRTGLALYPNSMGELPSIPDEIFQRYRANLAGSDIRRWQIDKKVKGFVSGSPGEWHDAILRWTRIDVSQMGADWGYVTELVQRRHVIVHNGGQVDAEYLRKVPEDLSRGLHIGSGLTSEFSYLDPVLVELETWATCLDVRWTKHFFKEDSIYNVFITGRIVSMESKGRWTQALAMADAILLEPLPSDEDLTESARLNRWFCLQELGRDNDALRRDIQAFQTDSDLLVLGRYALLRKYAELTKAIQEATEGQNAFIDKASLKEMPLIQRAMKESQQVKNILLSKRKPSVGVPQKFPRGKRPHR